MAASDPNIRASDDDRDRTASLLREHHAVGRLTPEEFNERLDKTFAAKTVGELDELLADLPAIDLYRLPDQSLKRHRPTPGHSSALAAAASAGAPAMRQHGRLSPAWQAAWGSWRPSGRGRPGSPARPARWRGQPAPRAAGRSRLARCDSLVSALGRSPQEYRRGAPR
jgi:hypothetical protein